jgi:hypothetical protein
MGVLIEVQFRSLYGNLALHVELQHKYRKLGFALPANWRGHELKRFVRHKCVAGRFSAGTDSCSADHLPHN